MNNIPGVTHPGVAIIFLCHDGEGNYLLSYRTEACRDEHNTWDGGGGALELHDTIQSTLHKEVKEEYDTSIINIEFLGVRDEHRIHNGHKTHWVAIDHKVQIDRKHAKNNEPEKFKEMKWFHKNNFPTNLSGPLQRCIKLYKNKL